jgi:hypothetical protein
MEDEKTWPRMKHGFASVFNLCASVAAIRSFVCFVYFVVISLVLSQSHLQIAMCLLCRPMRSYPFLSIPMLFLSISMRFLSLFYAVSRDGFAATDAVFPRNGASSKFEQIKKWNFRRKRVRQPRASDTSSSLKPQASGLGSHRCTDWPLGVFLVASCLRSNRILNAS